MKMKENIIFYKENRLCYQNPEKPSGSVENKKESPDKKYEEIITLLGDETKVDKERTQTDKLKDIARRKRLDFKKKPSVLQRPEVQKEYVSSSSVLEIIVRAKNELKSQKASKEKQLEKLQKSEPKSRLTPEQQKEIARLKAEINKLTKKWNSNLDEYYYINPLKNFDAGKVKSARSNIEQIYKQAGAEKAVDQKPKIKRLEEEIAGLDIMARSFELIEINIKVLIYNLKSLKKAKKEIKKFGITETQLKKLEIDLNLKILDLTNKAKDYKQRIYDIVNSKATSKEKGKDPLGESREKLGILLEETAFESMDIERTVLFGWYENIMGSIKVEDLKDRKELKRSLDLFRHSSESFVEQSGSHFGKTIFLKDILIATTGTQKLKNKTTKTQVAKLDTIRANTIKSLENNLIRLEKIKEMGPGFISDFFQGFASFMDTLTKTFVQGKTLKDTILLKKSPIDAWEELKDIENEDGVVKIKADLQKTCKEFDKDGKIKKMKEIVKIIKNIEDISSFEYQGKKGKEALRYLSNEFNTLNMALALEIKALMNKTFDIIKKVFEKKYNAEISKKIAQWWGNIMLKHWKWILGGGAFLAFGGGVILSSFVKTGIKGGTKAVGKIVIRGGKAGNNLIRRLPKTRGSAKELGKLGRGLMGAAAVGEALDAGISAYETYDAIQNTAKYETEALKKLYKTDAAWKAARTGTATTNTAIFGNAVLKGSSLFAQEGGLTTVGTISGALIIFSAGEMYRSALSDYSKKHAKEIQDFVKDDEKELFEEWATPETGKRSLGDFLMESGKETIKNRAARRSKIVYALCIKQGAPGFLIDSNFDGTHDKGNKLDRAAAKQYISDRWQYIMEARGNQGMVNYWQPKQDAFRLLEESKNYAQMCYIRNQQLKKRNYLAKKELGIDRWNVKEKDLSPEEKRKWEKILAATSFNIKFRSKQKVDITQKSSNAGILNRYAKAFLENKAEKARKEWENDPVLNRELVKLDKESTDQLLKTAKRYLSILKEKNLPKRTKYFYEKKYTLTREYIRNIRGDFSLVGKIDALAYRS